MSDNIPACPSCIITVWSMINQIQTVGLYHIILQKDIVKAASFHLWGDVKELFPVRPTDSIAAASNRADLQRAIKLLTNQSFSYCMCACVSAYYVRPNCHQINSALARALDASLMVPMKSFWTSLLLTFIHSVISAQMDFTSQVLYKMQWMQVQNDWIGCEVKLFIWVNLIQRRLMV